MPVDFGLVNPPSNVSAADGTNNAFLQGKQSELIVNELAGKYYTDAYRGNVYYASVAATGIVTTIFSNGTYVGGLLWNPQGSGKNLVPIRAMQGRILAATTVAAWGHAYLANAGAGVGTAAPVSARQQPGRHRPGQLRRPRRCRCDLHDRADVGPCERSSGRNRDHGNRRAGVCRGLRRQRHHPAGHDLRVLCRDCGAGRNVGAVNCMVGKAHLTL